MIEKKEKDKIFPNKLFKFYSFITILFLILFLTGIKKKILLKHFLLFMENKSKKWKEKGI
jgi:hypothetical protein